MKFLFKLWLEFFQISATCSLNSFGHVCGACMFLHLGIETSIKDVQAWGVETFISFLFIALKFSNLVFRNVLLEILLCHLSFACSMMLFMEPFYACRNILLVFLAFIVYTNEFFDVYVFPLCFLWILLTLVELWCSFPNAHCVHQPIFYNFSFQFLYIRDIHSTWVLNYFCLCWIIVVQFDTLSIECNIWISLFSCRSFTWFCKCKIKSSISMMKLGSKWHLFEKTMHVFFSKLMQNDLNFTSFSNFLCLQTFKESKAWWLC